MPTTLKRRTLARYDFENGSSVEIAITGDIDSAAAIKAASTLLSLKQEELGKHRGPLTLAKTG